MRHSLLLAILFILAAGSPRHVDRAGAIASAAARALTRRTWVAFLLVTAFPMVIRLALLPWWPIPYPVMSDEFSYIYAADTFASGRLVNPGHALWQFFEAPHLVVHPVMYSKYPPAQGLMMAAGQLLFGDPWFGVWLSSGILCAACYWLFLALVPRKWALLGGLLTACHLALTTYWMNSYWGGNVAAAGGALMLGAFLRLRRRPTPLLGAAFASGWTVLAASRPYEGAFLLGIPLAIVLLLGKRRPPSRVLLAGAAVAMLGGVALGGYNTALTGSPWKLPYMVHFEQYAYVPNFAFLPLEPKPAVRQDILRSQMEYDEAEYRRMNSPQRWEKLWRDWSQVLLTCLPAVLVLPFVLLSGWLLRSRRTRWLVIFLAGGIVILSTGLFRFTHYFAPFVPLVLLLTVVGLRLLSEERWRRAVLTALLIGTAVEGGLELRHEIANPPGPHMAALRPVVENLLKEKMEDHIIFVSDKKFAGSLRPSWVYNRANLDKAQVMWAADLGDEENQKLIAMYPTRRVWRLPIESPLTLQPYDARNALQQPVKIE